MKGAKLLGKLMLIGVITSIITISCNSKEKLKDSSFRPSELSLRFDTKIDSIISILSLEEKVNVLHATGKFWSGGIERLGIPELQYTDGPLGVREELERDSWKPAKWTNDSATFMPAGTAMGATWNTQLMYEAGKAIALEARARNKDVLLVPAINILRSPLNGRNYEYLTEDPFLNKIMVVPYIHGIQNQDVAACVKHFAVNNQETNRGSIDVTISERALREIYLPGFKAAVQGGQTYTIMGAYNKLRGDYLCESDYMLNQILKKEWGFKGAVVSDWGAVHNTIKAAKGGLDIEMGTEDVPYDQYFFAEPLLAAVKNGSVDELLIDEKVKRILRVAFNVKLGEKGRKKGAINTPENSELVYNLASEAIVLLKNDNHALPISIGDVNSIAVIGDNATRTFGSGGFGAGVKSRYEVTPLQGLKNRLKGSHVQINYALGYAETYIPGKNDNKSYGRIIDYSADEALIQEAVTVAKKSDYVVVFGGSNRHTESESIDRDDMRLPFAQEALIKAVSEVNSNVIVVLTVGTPYNMHKISKQVPALMLSWFNGSEAGNALADVILGHVNPSGHLPFTLPKKLSDSPAHALNAFPGSKENVEYIEDIYVGYRWFDTKNIDPLYCFGHGLSFTTFRYGSAETDKQIYDKEDTIKVSVPVWNDGAINGAEVVQLYVHHKNTKYEKPQKELKAFQKVWIETIQQKNVQLNVPVSELAFFNPDKNKWDIEEGDYEVLLGSSSRDIKSRVSFLIE